jgi:hypothetical protein
MAIHTPLDLQELNPNLVNGDLNAGSLHLLQFYGNRPFRGICGLRNADPGPLYVRRIHLAGRRRVAGFGNAAGQDTPERKWVKKEARGETRGRAPSSGIDKDVKIVSNSRRDGCEAAFNGRREVGRTRDTLAGAAQPSSRIIN